MSYIISIIYAVKKGNQFLSKFRIIKKLTFSLINLLKCLQTRIQIAVILNVRNTSSLWKWMRCFSKLILIYSDLFWDLFLLLVLLFFISLVMIDIILLPVSKSTLVHFWWEIFIIKWKILLIVINITYNYFFFLIYVF